MNNLEKLITDCLQTVNFTNRYIEICNSYPYYDERKNIKKAEIKQILDSENLDFKISGNENCFFKDYEFGDLNMRFLIGYKSGFIDALINFWNEDQTIQLCGGLITYCKYIDEKFSEKVKYRFPISTNQIMAKEIILKVVGLHKDFLYEFDSQWKNYLQQ
tara:strand:+ start:860 stop:1339 length:480 start_codon:yes stop_codon:yes gene_type:complete